MSFRGGGRGRGRGGWGRGRPHRAKQLPYETFPEIVGLKAVEYSGEEIRKYARLISWSQQLQNFCETSPYHYEDISQQRLHHVQKVDIEKYSDRKLRATKVKPPLWHFIKMDTDHMPAELARGEKRVAKKVRWDNEFDLSKLDHFEKLEEKNEGKEEEEEEEEEEENEDDGGFSSDGDYGQGEHFDDDEDDYNMADENDEAEY